MNSFIYFSISCLVFLSIILCVYFSKERIKSLENQLFTAILMTTVLGLIFEILSALIIQPNLFFIKIFLKKMFSITSLTWGMLFLYYNKTISNHQDEYKKLSIFDWIMFSIYLVTVFVIVAFPIYLKIDNQGLILNSYGVGQTFLQVILFGIALIILGILLTHYKTLKSKKYIPAIFFVVLLLGEAIIQMMHPTFLLFNFVLSVVVMLMYFTIENPDLKMLNELELAKRNAERANEAKTDFLSNMSHEIRTPLNAIVGFSNSILEDTSLEEAKTEAKDIIMASNNLLEIVNGILDISKIEAGKMEMVEVEYSPKSVLEDITKLILPRLEEKPIELKTDFSPDLPAMLYGDMGKVREIITNLLTNAVKYTDHGLIVFQISCINQKSSCKLVISVEDTGRGIKPDKIDKLFTKFQRLEEDRNTTLEGTGLGLAITKNLVEMMGGKIVVQSKYGSGSKFTVYLKQKIVKMVSEKVEVQEEKNTDIIDYSDKKILVVDDNMLNIKVAMRLLKNYNIVPDTALSGEEALKKVKEEQYDLIFMDDMMPKLSGVETFKKMQEDKNFQVPVIVLTANAVTGMREKYLSVGFTDYLAKPIDKLELIRVLKENLDKKDK